MVSYLTLKSLSHFKFISVCAVSMCYSFHDLHVAVQLSQYHLLKRLPFPHCILFGAKHFFFFFGLSPFTTSKLCGHLLTFAGSNFCFSY